MYCVTFVGSKHSLIIAKCSLAKPPNTNANPHSIWKLSDVDRDDHLSFEEYSIARFLVEEVKKGRVLPKELPSFLLPGWADMQTDQ